MDDLAPDRLAELFHSTYERLAPEHGYETRPDSATAWESVPEPNRSLMVAVAAEVLAEIRPVIAAEVLRDAAAALRQCADPRIGGSDMAAGISWAASTLVRRADDMGDDRE